MTTITFQHIDYAQRTQLLAYMRQNKLNFDISEPEEKQPTDTFIKSIEELQSGKIYRLANLQNPIEEILS